MAAASYDRLVTTEPASPTAGDTEPASADDARYQIGEVAERTGVTHRTLRFYEEKKLLQPSERMQGGFRLYSEQDIERIEQIKKLQSLLGMSLAEIKEMVDAEQLLNQIRATRRRDRDLPTRKKRVAQVEAALRLQRDIIDRKLDQLAEMRSTLDERLSTVGQRRQEIDDEISEALTEAARDGS